MSYDLRKSRKITARERNIQGNRINNVSNFQTVHIRITLTLSVCFQVHNHTLTYHYIHRVWNKQGRFDLAYSHFNVKRKNIRVYSYIVHSNFLSIDFFRSSVKCRKLKLQLIYFRNRLFQERHFISFST